MNNRNPQLNVQLDAIRLFSKTTQLSVYRKICLVRKMEKNIINQQKLKRINCSLYLSSGQEVATAALSESLQGYQIFAQHRSDDTFLSFGGSPIALRDELYGDEAGCSNGNGGHFGIQWHQDSIDMYGDNLLIGECVPRAVGAALGNNKKTLCIFGDGAGEEDYVLESLGFAATHKLPIVFVCTDNNLAILTEVKERRSWSLVDVASSFGIISYDVADDPWTIMKILDDIHGLPVFLNIRVCREYWHVGIGVDGEREWEREKIVRSQLIELGYESEVLEIEKNIDNYMKEVWGDEAI